MELSRPGALSELLGRKVVDQSGRRLGRVYEAKGHWERDGTVVIDELILGRGGARSCSPTTTCGSSPGGRSSSYPTKPWWCGGSASRRVRVGRI